MAKFMWDLEETFKWTVKTEAARRRMTMNGLVTRAVEQYLGKSESEPAAVEEPEKPATPAFDPKGATF